MVLFDEDPVTLISETTNQFHIAPDKESLSRLSSSLSALAVNRSSRLDAQRSGLKALSRKLNTLKSEHDYEQSRRDTGRHASEILALDGEKFRVAKTVNEIEAEGERLASELIGLRRQLDLLKSEGIDGGRRARSKDSDEAILKLQVYRSLGIELSAGDNGKNYGRAVIRNDRKNDVSIVDLDADATRDSSAVWECL